MTKRQAQNILRKKHNVYGMTLYEINENDSSAATWMVYIEGHDEFQVTQIHADARFDGKRYCSSCAREVAWNELACEYGLIGENDELTT